MARLGTSSSRARHDGAVTYPASLRRAPPRSVSPRPVPLNRLAQPSPRHDSRLFPPRALHGLTCGAPSSLLPVSCPPAGQSVSQSAMARTKVGSKRLLEDQARGRGKERMYAVARKAAPASERRRTMRSRLPPTPAPHDTMSGPVVCHRAHTTPTTARAAGSTRRALSPRRPGREEAAQVGGGRGAWCRGPSPKIPSRPTSARGTAAAARGTAAAAARRAERRRVAAVRASYGHLSFRAASGQL